MPTTVYLPEDTHMALMEIKHELERRDRRGYAWHSVLDELVVFWQNNRGHGGSESGSNG